MATGTAQPVTAERFAQGLTYDQYKAQMTRNQERFAATEQAVSFTPEDLAVWSRLPRPLHVLVLAEDWCGDVIDNLPILGRLAAETGKLDLRVFPRDQHLDIMDQYLKQGQFRSIPVFVFFDDRFNELGRFTERPDSVTEHRGRRRAQLFAQHPEFGDPAGRPDQLPEDVRTRLMQSLAAQRQEDTPFQQREVINALNAVAAKAAA